MGGTVGCGLGNGVGWGEGCAEELLSIRISEVLFVEECTGSTSCPRCVLPVGRCDIDRVGDPVVEITPHVPHVFLQTSRAGPVIVDPSSHDEIFSSQIDCLRSLSPSHPQV